MPFFCIHCRSEIDPKFRACPHCGEAVSDFLRKHLEAPIDGKYQILSRLGIGGMGEVFKALHVHLNALRVLKLMRANIANDPGAHERFLREARMATKIHHPNVAALFDFSTLDDGSRYMVWEYIEGTNLHELIDECGPLSPRYAARLAAQALHGLDAIHKAGIVHRDISPENLMIARDEDGEEHVKIIDLGIAKQWGDPSDTQTKTGMFVGKWKYCSPEHLGMLPAGERIDGRADIYSFGIVIYEMLTGVAPFQADTPHGFVVMHASQSPRAMRDVNPSIKTSPELEALIFRSLEKDRNKRFASAREFAKELEALLPTLDDTAGAPPPLPQAIEVTADPTRVSANNNDVATLVTNGALGSRTAEPTVETPPPHFSDAMMSRTTVKDPHPTPSTPPPHPSRRMRWTAGALTAVVAAIVAAMMTREPSPVASVPQVDKASLIATTRGHVGINAYPWGEVTKIRNVDSGAMVKFDAPLVTPAPLDLAPGKYEITLANPAFRDPITQTIDVRANEEANVIAQFSDPRRAKLPKLEGTP
jgi:serine/threonine-protein kinase